MRVKSWLGGWIFCFTRPVGGPTRPHKRLNQCCVDYTSVPGWGLCLALCKVFTPTSYNTSVCVARQSWPLAPLNSLGLPPEVEKAKHKTFKGWPTLLLVVISLTVTSGWQSLKARAEVQLVPIKIQTLWLVSNPERTFDVSWWDHLLSFLQGVSTRHFFLCLIGVYLRHWTFSQLWEWIGDQCVYLRCWSDLTRNLLWNNQESYTQKRTIYWMLNNLKQTFIGLFHFMKISVFKQNICHVVISPDHSSKVKMIKDWFQEKPSKSLV